MKSPFFCADCRSEHTEPADASLGHLLICLECAMHREVLDDRFDIPLAEATLAA